MNEIKCNRCGRVIENPPDQSQWQRCPECDAKIGQVNAEHRIISVSVKASKELYHGTLRCKCSQSEDFLTAGPAAYSVANALFEMHSDHVEDMIEKALGNERN